MATVPWAYLLLDQMLRTMERQTQDKTDKKFS